MLIKGEPTPRLAEHFPLWLNTITIHHMEELFNYAHAGKSKLTPEKQTAESPVDKKVKRWGN